ncbi:LacI family DNA-binding transcriptional regulator, partial [Anaerolineales bacterium HSG25]|nr:LacI family DNA-binding transcriptional regulator [Anaerolineales bacterium HSG25]
NKKSVITIRDIAREANVSASTVSRVLNNTTAVTENKRQAVLEAVKKLNYRPNIIAQGLVRGQSMAIGILTQDLASPFYGGMHQGIEQGLSTSGYQPLFVSGNWTPSKEIEALDMLVQRQVDGLIIMAGTVLDERIRQIAERMPLVVVGGRLKDLEKQCLQIDNQKAAYTATQHLIELGHRRIVHITGMPTHPDAIKRKQGYEQALNEADIEIDPTLIIEGTFRRRSGLFAIETLLTRGTQFSAIFAANDQITNGVYLALFRRGIRIPDDVSIVGFDDQRYSAYMSPPLTTIYHPIVEMGVAAAKAVITLINGEPINLPVPSTKLVIRESTGIYK